LKDPHNYLRVNGNSELFASVDTSRGSSSGKDASFSGHSLDVSSIQSATDCHSGPVAFSKPLTPVVYVGPGQSGNRSQHRHARGGGQSCNHV
jgi:hypothetical protein